MTITLHWWLAPIILAAIPFVYGAFRKSSGNWWDMQIDTTLIAAICWCLAIGLVIGHLIA